MNRTIISRVLRLSNGTLGLSNSKPSLLTGGATATSSGYQLNPIFFALASKCCYSNNVRVRSYLQYIKRKIQPPTCPPYNHVCQVGDPVLRSQAADVDPATISSPEVQGVIKTMVKVMRRLECVGLSAPQVGVPLRIVALEYPVKMMEESSPASREARGLSVQPLRIFVNPTLRVLDGRTVLFQEACESISGFSATVPRYLSVEVSGLNEKAEPVSWQVSGWPARIIQHEMDHLDGLLYLDRMDSKTFINIKWQTHNE
ncbi:peptide deformylase, mitochondrial [Gadus macrocephalus]|uniref:peptide deformylase, mitochondrial n=1 Tax=Gadus macrocephalus TaxID=80720 RepID=UPI0028CB9D76|nr:peptide deformylase, mitochondrial [Gadus macrocephalus]